MFRKKRPNSVSLTPEEIDEVLGTLDTGDIVLFSGKGAVSHGIKWFTVSRWSHLGVVLRLPERENLLLWESLTKGYMVDVEHGEIRRGVQLVDLARRIASYDGGVAVRRLDIQRTDEMQRAVDRLREELAGRPYEQSNIELIRAAVDIKPIKLTENVEDLSSIFCSELVAETYQRMGLLPEDIPSNEYTPHDFSADRTLPLVTGSLGPEIIIKPD